MSCNLRRRGDLLFVPTAVPLLIRREKRAQFSRTIRYANHLLSMTCCDIATSIYLRYRLKSIKQTNICTYMRFFFALTKYFFFFIAFYVLSLQTRLCAVFNIELLFVSVINICRYNWIFTIAKFSVVKYWGSFLANSIL